MINHVNDGLPQSQRIAHGPLVAGAREAIIRVIIGAIAGRDHPIERAILANFALSYKRNHTPSLFRKFRFYIPQDLQRAN